MADSAVTKYVFLDTEVFEAHQLDFASPNIRRIVRLAAANHLKLVLTTVTKREILAHVTEKADEAFKAIRNFRHSERLVRKYLPEPAMVAIEGMKKETMRARAQEEFEEFLTETKATVLGIEGVPSEEIFEKYFEGTAPFKAGRKKSEFPDAFAFAAIQAWCPSHAPSGVYIVSNDSDWKRACGEGTKMHHVEKLDSLLQLFADSMLVAAITHALEDKHEELVEKFTEQALQFDCSAGSNVLDGEIVEVEDAQVELEEFHVVEAKDGKASISVACTVTITALVYADDPESTYYDRETGHTRSVFRASGRVTRELDMVAEVEITYNQADPEQIAIDDAQFEDTFIDLNVGEGELSRVEDEDATLDELNAPEGPEWDEMNSPGN